MTRTEPRWARTTAWIARHPWAGVTVWAAVVFMLAASVARAFTYPPLNGGDEPAHLDYVISVWHLHLPVFEKGITYHAPFGETTPVQWVSQHPPLYYLVLAPVVGPLFDGGHPLVAVIAGRLMSGLMAGGVVVASAWAAWRCFPGSRRLPGAVAVVTAFAGMVIQQGGSIYNDILFVLLLVLACGVAGAAIRTGMGPGLAVASAVVGAAGMTTRLSFALWLVALVVATVLARRVQLWGLGGVWARIVAAAAPVVAAGAASGWFYLHNKATSGNFSGRHAEWGIENMGRVVRPVREVALDGGFWTGLFGIYRGVLPPSTPVQWVLMILPMLLAAVVGVVVLIRRRRSPAVGRAAARSRRRDRLSTWLIVAMFVVVSALLTVIEIDYVHGGGAANTRYALTILPVITIAMAAGLTGFRRASGALVLLWVAVSFVPYLSLVDLHVAGIVPHAARVVQLMFAVSVLAAVGCVVGAFVDQRHREPAALPAGPRAFRHTPPASAVDQEARASANSVR
ncbi:hypothetical protein ACLBWP_08165 [Microbacterium sp. M1A1_1b]